MGTGSDPDDWFGDPSLAAPGATETPPSERAGAPEDWLNEADSQPARRRRAGTIDRRLVAAGAVLFALLILGLALGGVFSGGGTPKADTSTSSPATTTAGPATTPAAKPLPAPASTLKPGDTGPQVAVLQRALASLGFSGGKADGQYGPATKSAVARFQRSVRLTADGIVGPATLRALAKALRGP